MDIAKKYRAKQYTLPKSSGSTGPRGLYPELLRRIVSRKNLSGISGLCTDETWRHTEERSRKKFNAAVQDLPHIMTCHMRAAVYDYLLKVRTSDISKCRHFLTDTIDTLNFDPPGDGISLRINCNDDIIELWHFAAICSCIDFKPSLTIQLNF